MDAIIDLLTSYGYWGMLLAAFLAGSFFPFSSEAVMVGLMAAGLDPWLLMVYGTVGNVMGSVVNYCIGLADKLDLDLKACVLEKLEKNAAKYPVEKCKGKATKYDKL